MTSETTPPSAQWALLIGIARYLPNQLPNGQSYPSLEGPVRDVERMESFLLRRLLVPPEQILKLTSSGTEPPERRPSYENIVAAWRALTERARPGEQVLIFYSGHGGRVPTLVPEVKGQRGIDECLVPFDVGNPDARYLRDVEIARLLAEMVEKNLFVTLVLDCCHSGGLTRGKGAAVRGLSTVDTTPRPHTSLVASPAGLAALWRQLAGEPRRSVTLASGWLQTPRGYVLLAACQAHQTAFELTLDEQGKSGALSYWLAHELEKLEPRLSWRQLHQRLLGQIHGRFESQTPVVEGEVDRAVFGSRELPQPAAVDVLRIDPLRGRVLIGTGEAQGVARGDRFVVYPADSDAFEMLAERLAEIKIEELGATCSWARTERRFGEQEMVIGDRAMLIEPGALRLRRAVQLLGSSRKEMEILAAVERRLLETGTDFLELARPGVAADFQIAIDPFGELEILDPSGCSLPRLGSLPATDPTTPARMVERLIHLAKYLNVRTLENPAPFSPLKRGLAVELLRLPRGYRPGEPLDTRPFDDDAIPTAREDDWICLRIRNRSGMILYLTLLDLQPDWGIAQIHPAPDSFGAATLERGQALDLPFQAHLFPGMREGTDVIKIFVTLDATDFRWLQLPALEKPPSSSQKAWRKEKPLEQLFAAMATRLPPRRELEPSAAAALEWECAQVRVRVVAGSPST